MTMIINPFMFGPGGGQLDVLLAEDGDAFLSEDGDWNVLEDAD